MSQGRSKPRGKPLAHDHSRAGPTPGLQPALAAVALAIASAALAQSTTAPPTSAWVHLSPAGPVWSLSDERGNRIPNFSTVGYAGGEREPPVVPARVLVQPGPGDDTARIQQAIDALARISPDSSGFRGAVLLAPGEFQISNQITIRTSGIVLRGSGRGTNGTVLRATGPGQRTLVLVAGSGSPQTIPGSTRNILDPYVPVGAHTITLDSVDGLNVGDRVLVRRIANDAWIHDLGMDLLCCPPDVQPWSASSYQIDMDRRIVAIEGNTIFLDTPIVCAIESRYGGGTVRRFTWEGRIQHVGIEDLEGVSDFTAPDDENHAWTFIQLQAVEHAWVRRVTARHFGFAAVSLGRGARNVTVSECEGLDPVSQVTGGRRYAFVMDDAELCLVRECRTRQDRHQFVTQSLTTGPNVFVDGLSENALSDAGPHHRWATGALWDNIEVQGHDLNVQNRGNLGSGHGWAGANCVVWNCRARSFVVQNPPTARNWLIGSVGTLKEGTVYVGPHDPGTIDQHGFPVFPRSLYYAQLQHRLHFPGLQIREYWAGIPDGFDTNNPAAETATADPEWLAQIQSQAGNAPIGRFDDFLPGQWIPVTFRWTAPPGTQIVAAALQFCLQTPPNPHQPGRILLETLDASIPIDTLLPGPAAPDGSAVYLLDLNSRPADLTDGRLNLALQGDLAVDWMRLELHLAPLPARAEIRFLPEADTWVREPATAEPGHGTDPILAVGRDPTPGNERRAHLRWPLDRWPAQWAQTLLLAKVELTPLAVSSSPTEQALASTTQAPWDETNLTWQTQPTAHPPIATWIPQPAQTVSVAVTPQVTAALSQRQPFTIQIAPAPRSPSAGHATYASREYPGLRARPWLVLALPADAVPRPRFHNLRLAQDTLQVDVEDHPAGARYRVLTSPDAGRPLTDWTSLLEAVFPETSTFTLTLPVPSTNHAAFYLLEMF
jgi:hypothetical protein